MIIDMHTHVGNDREGNSQTIEQLKRRMKRDGVNRAVIFPFNENGDLVKSSVKLLDYKSTTIIPFLRFDPKSMTAEEVESLLASYDFSGVKLHPRAQNFDPLNRKYDQIYKTIAKSGKPLLIHTGRWSGFNSDPERIVKLGNRFKDLDIILGHLASFARKAIETVAREDNLYIETSVFGTNYVIKMLNDRIGSDKILFGSDCPYSDQEIEVLKIKKADISKRDKEKILYRNASKLLKL